MSPSCSGRGRRCGTRPGHADVGCLLVAVADDRTPDVIADGLDPDAVLLGDVGQVGGGHGHEYHSLVQDLVVCQVMHQRMRDGVGVGAQKDRRAGYAGGGVLQEAVEEWLQGHAVGLQPFKQDAPLPLPCGQEHEHQRPHGEWKPAAVQQFQGVGTKKGEVDAKEHDEAGDREPPRPAPQAGDHHEAQDRGDDHGAGHRDAIGRGQVGGSPKPRTRTMHPGAGPS